MSDLAEQIECYLPQLDEAARVALRRDAEVCRRALGAQEEWVAADV